MSKKVRLIALAIVFLVAFSACNSGGTTSSPAGSTPAASTPAGSTPATSTPAADDPYADFPNKPITIVLPFGAGGSHDAHVRLMEKVAPKYLNGQTFIVELKPGGSGAVGCAYGANANPDGYTLIFGSNGNLTVLPIAEEVPYSRDDFIPISRINYSPSIIVTDANHWKTVEELIEDTKANPGEFSFASSGMFNSGHMAMEVFQKNAGIQFNHVPMEGAEPQLAVLGGQVELCGAFADEILDLVEDGSLVPLAVSSIDRIIAYPDLPSFGDLGYDMEWNMWRGVFAPAGTPPEIVEKLDNIFRSICEDPEFIELVEKMGEEVHYQDRNEFREFWDEETVYFENLFAENPDGF